MPNNHKEEKRHGIDAVLGELDGTKYGLNFNPADQGLITVFHQSDNSLARRANVDDVRFATVPL